MNGTFSQGSLGPKYSSMVGLFQLWTAFPLLWMRLPTGRARRSPLDIIDGTLIFYGRFLWLVVKGGLISESVTILWSKYPQMGAKSLTWPLSNYRKDAQGIDLAPTFGDLCQSEKLFEIRPPLMFFGLIKLRI